MSHLRCLEIPEILQTICEFVCEGERDPSSCVLSEVPSRDSAKNTLISLAVSSSLFTEIALDTLWHTQMNFVRLIKCLPEEMWVESPQTGFQRELLFRRSPRESDFKRFDYYACKIRRLEYWSCGWHRHTDPPFDLGLLDELATFKSVTSSRKSKTSAASLSRPYTLFPNLRFVRFNRHTYLPIVSRLFFHNELVTLSLRYRAGSVDAYTALAVFPLKHSSHLQHLELDEDSGGGGKDVLEHRLRGHLHSHVQPSDQGTGLSDFVCGLKYLRSLKTTSHLLNLQAIRHLAYESPQFEVLKFSNSAEDILLALKRPPLDDDADNKPPAAGLGEWKRDGDHEPAFPNLRCLECNTTSLQVWPGLLRRLSPTRLQEITLHCKDLPLSNSLHAFLLALEKSSSPDSLATSLTLTHAWKSFSPRVDADVLVTAAVLEPLKTFARLTKLDLSLACAFAMDDEQLAELAEGWPELRHVQLGSALGWGRASGVTLWGLAALVRACPRLEHIGLSLDATGAVPQSRPDPHTLKSSGKRVPRNDAITYLHLGDSKVDGPREVARFLKGVFPNLMGIGGVWLYNSSGAFMQPERHSHALWQEVVAALPTST